MDLKFANEYTRGRRAAQSVLKKKKDKLITCWVSEELREKAYKVCPNVSEFIRTCLERMVESKLDKQITKLYTNIADEVLEKDNGKFSHEELSQESRS